MYSHKRKKSNQPASDPSTTNQFAPRKRKYEDKQEDKKQEDKKQEDKEEQLDVDDDINTEDKEEQLDVDDDIDEEIGEEEKNAETIAGQVLKGYGDYVQARNIKQGGKYGTGKVCSELYEQALSIFDGLSDTSGYAAYSMTAKAGKIDHVALLIAPAGLDPYIDIDQIVAQGFAVDLWAYICCPASEYETVFGKTLEELVETVLVNNQDVKAKVFVEKLQDKWKISPRQ